MATKLRLDPQLAEIVERARRQASAAGDLEPPRVERFESPLPAAARRIVQEWLDDGGYATAIAAIAADDPDLASQ